MVFDNISSSISRSFTLGATVHNLGAIRRFGLNIKQNEYDTVTIDGDDELSSIGTALITQFIRPIITDIISFSERKNFA